MCAVDDRSLRPFAPWLNRIVVNRALTLIARDPWTVPLDEEVHAARDGASASARELMAALDGLSPDRRVVVVLRSVLGFSAEEAASILGIAVGTVHSRLHRAMADLRRALEVPAR